MKDPKPGTTLALALEHMAANPTREYTSDELQAATGRNRKLVAEVMQDAIAVKRVYMRKVVGRCLYSLTPHSVADLLPSHVQSRRPADPMKVARAPIRVEAVRRADGVLQCPSCLIDQRFQIDPATFTGGELVREWKRLRGEA